MTLNKPAIILVDPQMGENIGAAARAMLNCGLTDLRIVRPRDGWPNPAADAMSAGALERMPPVQVFETTEAALSGFQFVLATTARPRDMIKPVFTPRTAAAALYTHHYAGQKTALLFGAERAGLSNDDVALAHGIITIPVNPDFSSLNLGQAVLLTAYEWHVRDEEMKRERDDGNEDISSSHHPSIPSSHIPAPHEQMVELFERLESELETHHFFRTGGQKPIMVRNLRNMLLRAGMTEQETRTFHGIISALTGKKSRVMSDE